jgi:5-methylcytosine-specific restriction endonuclease McrA
MSAYVSVELQQQVRSHFQECCAYCHTFEPLSVVPFEMEHIIPLSVGGSTDFDNLCLACPVCNRHKSNRQVALDPLTDREVALFHPHEQQWHEHFAWITGSTELTGLTTHGRCTIAALQMNRPRLIALRSLWI